MRMVEASKREGFPMRQGQNWLATMHSQYSMAVPVRPSQTRLEVCSATKFIAATLIGIAAWCGPVAAAVCRVPTAVLCEGCVEQLSIRVVPGGTCRVSFTPAAAPEQAEHAGSVKFVDINIETVPPRAAVHRVSVPHLSIAGNPVRLRPSSGCFVFNGRRFCE